MIILLQYETFLPICIKLNTFYKPTRHRLLLLGSSRQYTLFRRDKYVGLYISVMWQIQLVNSSLTSKRFHVVLATSYSCGRSVFTVYIWCMFAFNDQQICHFNCPLKSLPSNRAFQDAFHEYVQLFSMFLGPNFRFYWRKSTCSLPSVAFRLF
jgi:hypothetical protein